MAGTTINSRTYLGIYLEASNQPFTTRLSFIALFYIIHYVLGLLFLPVKVRLLASQGTINFSEWTFRSIDGYTGFYGSNGGRRWYTSQPEIIFIQANPYFSCGTTNIAPMLVSARFVHIVHLVRLCRWSLWPIVTKARSIILIIRPSVRPAFKVRHFRQPLRSVTPGWPSHLDVILR